MKKSYVKPLVKQIPVATRQIMCSSGYEIGVNSEIKKYGCPIKKGLDCPDYDKKMNEWIQWIKGLSKRRDSVIFYQETDDIYCPRNKCPIYLKWKNQQKTR